MGKPLFYTTPLWGEGVTPIKKYKAAWIPEKAADVFTQLKKVHNNPGLIQKLQFHQKRFLKDVVGFTKFDSSERTAHAISEILNSK